MYYLFKHHDVLPSVYKALPAGEQIVLRAFAMQELEDRG